MAKEPAAADQNVTRALGAYAGMVSRVLTDPQRWLGLDDDPPPSAPFPVRALDALRDRTFGETTPASPQWPTLPVDKRVGWWVTRIGISAGLAAAAPRVAGALANRVPLQASLGASAAGLAVCATAREHGLMSPEQWVPLLAKVLFDREVDPAAVPVPASEASEDELSAEPAEADPSQLGKLGRGAQRAALTVWRLARTLYEVQDVLDERPRGRRLARMLAQLPVVGVAGGWLDERGGIRKASRETARLLR